MKDFFIDGIKYEYSFMGNTFKLKVRGRIDTTLSAKLENMTDYLIAGNDIHKVEIDCSNLEYISSMGLRWLLGLQKKTRAIEFRLIHTNDDVRTILESVGYDSIMTIIG